MKFDLKAVNTWLLNRHVFQTIGIFEKTDFDLKVHLVTASKRFIKCAETFKSNPKPTRTEPRSLLSLSNISRAFHTF